MAEILNAGNDPKSHIDGVDITALLSVRTSRQPDYFSENAALAALASTLAERPDQITNELAKAALQLTNAHSAGLSLEEEVDGKVQFRWVATAGDFEKYLHATLPRHFSPCGEVLDRNESVLMKDPVRRYGYISDLDNPVVEVLLTPFHSEGKPIGTVWVVSHDDSKAFNSEDRRVLRSLTKFAAASVQTLGLIDQLREMNVRKDKFLAMLSHEMRSPLQSIKLSAQTIKRLPHDIQALQKYADIVERQTARLIELVNDITDISSIRNNQLPLHIDRITAQDIVSNALEACDAHIQIKAQQLNLSVPNAPLLFNGDAFRLTQVLINLISNASKYTPAGGKIHIVVEEVDDLIVFKVIDSGIGIPKHLLSKVFDLFMQVETHDRPTYSGLGLGLSLVRQFVELHGGTVIANSDGEGRGSEFIVKLPRGELDSLESSASRAL